MQVGDLVRRSRWKAWTDHNPWMHTEKCLDVGMIVEVNRPLLKSEVEENQGNMKVFCVLIGSKRKWFSENELNLINDHNDLCKIEPDHSTI